ncbi:phosphomevalonate kinase [Leucobacter massiliensis]|uniref:phosphomevalonate kinase n=1 Tax=Leucobacter massiliensis TaxID=1686285 RepID=A0A2S9QPB2_9MICO|nr:phosphomevalonate kinase [Leucobacter massiliensis]PRI11423.1 phosphomevalonate kinase [Leucobacter massiliensis]
MIECFAPGKLFIAGEYAVVEPGEPAVLVAVDHGVHVRLEASEGAGRVRSSSYGPAARIWVRDRDSGRVVPEREPLDYVFAAIDAAEQLRAERGLPPRFFDLDIGSALEDDAGRKYGLGSSGAVTVAVIAAIDRFAGLGLDAVERCKLALLATVEVSPRASGGDVAASTFGGWIRYTAPDRAALRASRQRHGVAATLASEEAWRGFSVTRLPEPGGVRLLVGWTGSPVSTELMVAETGRSVLVDPRPGLHVPEAGGDDVSGPPAREASSGPSDPASFAERSRRCVDALAAGIEEGDGGAVLDAVRSARSLLRGLGEQSGVEIETAQLAALCDTAERHGAAAKPSGAGGGDCGIALVPVRGGAGAEADASADADADAIVREWESRGIRVLPLAASVREDDHGR